MVGSCLLFYMVQTRHWPLVGDAAFVHYVVFLWEHGKVPFRQIVETQMPGVYLSDRAMMYTFGADAIGLRVFDDTLGLAIIACMIAIVWPQRALHQRAFRDVRWLRDNRWAAFLAGGLFVLVHGRDGLAQSGQRDLVMAVLLLATCVCVFWCVRRHRAWLLGIAGFLTAAAVTIKPTVFLAGAALLLCAWIELRRQKQSMLRYGIAGICGILIPFIGCLIFLLHLHAVGAFQSALSGVFRYYSTLQRRSPGYLLLHSISPLLPLVVAWVLTMALRMAGRRRLLPASSCLERWEFRAIYSALFLSFASYAVQGKGLPYHRYPFIGFLLLVMALDFKAALDHSTRDSPSKVIKAWRLSGVLGLCIGGCVIAPLSAYKISQFDWQRDDFRVQLASDITGLGGSALSGHVQCLDAFAGCISTLYQMRLVESTGFLVDFYFYSPEDRSRQTDPAVFALRDHFWKDIQASPPRVFVVTNKVFPSYSYKSDSYGKLLRWPEFDTYLQGHYSLFVERSFPGNYRWATRPESPDGYRIYVRKP